MSDAKQVMAEVRATIEMRGSSEAATAQAIGVSAGTLARHLAGAYVRSDSIAKYRHWLASAGDSAQGRPAPATRSDITSDEVLPSEPSDPVVGPMSRPAEPLRVVDLFAGCGGLSLGFELAGGGGLFRTVLAIDIEEAMVRVFNANHPVREADAPVGRQADLSEFLSEAEVLAFYLDHLASAAADEQLRRELDGIAPLGIRTFVQVVRALDEAFVEQLLVLRRERRFLDAYSAVDKASLSQTSVLGFHHALKLPQPGTARPTLQSSLWSGDGRSDGLIGHMLSISRKLERECATAASTLWEQEIDKLRGRASGSGSGQLASAAAKIGVALQLLDGDPYQPVRHAWLHWRTKRDAVRRTLFEDESVLEQLRAIYRNGRSVHVLLGGPPCQGFSRIGRGKIRSLREQSVHVQSDAKAGDHRNELLLQYVLFVAALEPASFLFENVRHFQAEVKTPEGTFKATDVLAEAIAGISRDGLEYAVDSRILVASNHLVPQTRERFFMVGVRRDLAAAQNRTSPASWCLSLPTRQVVALKTALMGLPEPTWASASSERAGGTDRTVAVDDLHVRGNETVAGYLEWVRQAPPSDRPRHDHRQVDAHCARDSRPDDRAFFEMLGPGKRWMDYRCDGNPLVDDLASLVRWVLAGRKGDEIAGLPRDRVEQILSSLDGSLSLRLLLDRIPLGPGEHEHHLSAANYLKKREGSHGDWLARLDAETPSKTMVAHMGKDTYAYIHPSSPRTVSVREAARVQTFPDWYRFGSVGLVDGYRVIGNAVPPLLSAQLALRVAVVLEEAGVMRSTQARSTGVPEGNPAAPSTQPVLS